MAAKRFVSFLSSLLVLGLAITFVIKFAGPNLLRQYISYGIGDCKTIPILCMQPEEKVFLPEVNKEYRDTLVLQNFPKFSISVPKGFALVQELIKRKYYKKKHAFNDAVIYLLYQEPNTFIKLYPDVQKQGVKDNYEFIRRLMYANLSRVDNITEAFFIIMKSVFTPDIGNQNIAKMINFEIENKKGFISYILAKPMALAIGSQTTTLRSDNYFDCNVLDNRGNFFKVYIKDKGSRLDLNNVFTIISTLKPVNVGSLAALSTS